MAQFLKYSIVCVLLFTFFSTCKKGEDDPAISFRSRKARLAGKWRLKSGAVTITTVDFSAWEHLNQIYTLSNSRFQLTETGPGAKPDLSTGAYFLNLECTKDGTFKLDELYNPKKLEVSGEWSFMARSSNKKAKEYISFKIKNTANGKTSGYFLFNQSSIEFTYRIKELRNKEMVLEVQSDIYVDANTQFYQEYKGEYTFIQ